MPITSDILPDREQDNEELTAAEAAIPIPNGVAGKEWFVNVWLIGWNHAHLSIPVEDDVEGHGLIKQIFDDGFLVFDHEVFPLHYIARFHVHVRSEVITVGG